MSEGRGCGCAEGDGHVGFEQGLVLSGPGQEQTPWGLRHVPKPPGSFLAACTHPLVPSAPRHQRRRVTCTGSISHPNPSLSHRAGVSAADEIPFPLLQRNFLQYPQSKRCPPFPRTPPVAAPQVPAPSTPAGPALARLGQWAPRAGGNVFKFLPLA